MWVNGRATRSWREGTPDSYVHEPTIVFDPVHYLALIERKINALDQAAPLARCARSAWGAPVRGDIARARAGRTTVRPPSLSVATLAVTGAWCGPDALVAIPARPEGEGSAGRSRRTTGRSSRPDALATRASRPRISGVQRTLSALVLGQCHFITRLRCRPAADQTPA
jgi:hypothetical protein